MDRHVAWMCICVQQNDIQLFTYQVYIGRSCLKGQLNSKLLAKNLTGVKMLEKSQSFQSKGLYRWIMSIGFNINLSVNSNLYIGRMCQSMYYIKVSEKGKVYI
jgi:hypothetical protein